jgi:hypothetical protein
MKETKEFFKNLFNELQNKDQENYALFSHMYNLQINVDELTRSIEKYKKHLNEIDTNQKDKINKRQQNFDKIEVCFLIKNVLLK